MFICIGATVLVQGSAGIDGTLQVTSLSQIILDPDCRTIRGYVSLYNNLENINGAESQL